MLGYLLGVSPGARGLDRVKPGLMFLLGLAWESKTRLPLLIMSAFMALGIRIQLEINIDRAVRYIPRFRLEEDDLVPSDDDTTESIYEGGYISEYDYDSESEIYNEFTFDVDDTDEEEEELCKECASTT